MSLTVWTIGHSDHRIERLIELLNKHEISGLGDVRSQPFSRLHPQFNRDALHAAIESAAMTYAFLGEELGARSKDPECFVHGRVSYALLSRTTAFQRGLERIVTDAERGRLSLLCAEKDPLMCHRTILIARCLQQRGVSVLHILSNGSIETQDASTNRLQRELGLDQPNLFRSREEIIAEAFRIRGDAIAYRPIAVQETEGSTNREGSL